MFVQEVKRRIFSLLRGMSFICLVFYFAYHLVSGENSALAMMQLRQKVDTARAELNSIDSEKISLERRVGTLYAKSLDKDMLEEQTRRQLGYAGRGEIVYFPSETH